MDYKPRFMFNHECIFNEEVGVWMVFEKTKDNYPQNPQNRGTSISSSKNIKEAIHLASLKGIKHYDIEVICHEGVGFV